MTDWQQEQDQLGRELADLEAKGLRRRIRELEAAPGPRTVYEGREYLLFSTNNYLGMAQDSEVVEAAREALDRWGLGSTGAALTTGTQTPHRQLEQAIANLKGTEDALVYPTGYMANVGIISALMGPEGIVFSDELNHASIIDGCRLSRSQVVVFKHRDLADLKQKLMEHPTPGRRLIVSDGVFSMDGDLCPLPGLVELAEAHGCWLMIDDAHATGVLGDHGGGTAEHFGLKGRVPLQMGTLSKAVGALGGYLAASREVVEYLRNRSRSFIFATSLPPAVAAGAAKSIELLAGPKGQELRRNLVRRTEQMRVGLAGLGFTVLPSDSPILAVLIGDAGKAAAYSAKLLDHGLFVPAIRPPTVPPGTSRLRVTLTAAHSQEDVDQALAIFAKAGREIDG